MSTVETRKFEPVTGTAVNLGASGDAVTLPAGVTLQTNTIKDAGGNTIFTSDGAGNLSSVNSGLQGNMVFISSQTASSSASVSFTSGIDSTYDEYWIVWFGMILSAQNEIGIKASTDGGSNFGIAKTTTFFQAIHSEDDSSASLVYESGQDEANSTDRQHLTREMENSSDDGACGIVKIYAPSSTTYVKHFVSRSGCKGTNGAMNDAFVAGYWNTTSAINAFRLEQGGGNITRGTFALYGIK
tara:strand:+ start:516 stop:1241 length:726 start_codon:yes stop_codon:yes gene_type:complete